MLSTLRGDGNVLLPIDSAGRVLELVLLFERAWAEGRLTYPLALLSPMVGGWVGGRAGEGRGTCGSPAVCLFCLSGRQGGREGGRADRREGGYVWRA